MISENDLRNILRHKCEAAGTQRAWAQQHGICEVNLCQVLKGQRAVTDAMASALGYLKIVQFTACVNAKHGAKE
jgi:hypothetical protein